MSTAINSAFQRIDTEYRPQPTPPSYPAYTGFEPFSANRAFDKLIGLCIFAVVSAAIGYIAVPIGVAYGFGVVAFVLALTGWFRMGWARYLAPAYSVVEGLALGAVSRQFATFGHGVVPSAIVFTAAVFVAALVLYRTGLVRVTPRMVTMAFMGAIGIAALGLLSLIGLSVPGLNQLTGAGLVFTVFALGIAVLNLFTDFNFVYQAEAQGISSEAEWVAAFAMMTALVLVYISMLRLLGAAAGGGRRR